MKIQVIYSSLTGCTRKVAEAIYHGITEDSVSIHDLKDGIPVLDGDIILAGYWGISGHPDEKTIEFLKTINGKAVGVFCTLGYYADSAHAFDTVQYGVNLLKEKNQIIGSYVCNGTISQELIRGQGLDYPHTPSEQKEIRWEITKDHPSTAECELAAERFRERIYLYKRCLDLNIPFTQIL